MPARSPDREIRFGQESVGEPAPTAGTRRVLPDFGDSRRGRDSSNRLRATPLRNKLEELEESRPRRVGGRYAESWQLLTAIPRAARAAAGPSHAGRIRLEQSGRGIPGAKLQRHRPARETNSYRLSPAGGRANGTSLPLHRVRDLALGQIRHGLQIRHHVLLVRLHPGLAVGVDVAQAALDHCR